jgi:hypothetical protein
VARNDRDEPDEDDGSMLAIDVAKRERKGQDPLFLYLTEELSARLEQHRLRLEKRLSEEAGGGAKVKITKATIVRGFIEEGLKKAEADAKRKK